jgi:hypothetical protein
MAKGKKEPELITIGSTAALAIVAIVKRHANVRFENSRDRDLCVAEIANLVPSIVVDPEHAPAPEAAGCYQQQEGEHDNGAGQDEDRGKDKEQAPGTQHEGD